MSTLRGADLPRVAIDSGDGFVETQLDAMFVVVVRGRQGQRVGVLTGEVVGQVDTVIGEVAFFAEYRDAVVMVLAAFDQLFDEVMADHAVAHHDKGGAGVTGGGV